MPSQPKRNSRTRTTQRKGPNKAQQRAAAIRAAQTHEDVFAANPTIFDEDTSEAGDGPRRRSGVRTPVMRSAGRVTRPVVTVRKLTREQEYSFIKADLKRLLVTAGSLAAVMIVLLFVLEM